MCTSAAPGIRARFRFQLARDLVIGRDVAAHHLHVDGRGQPEVENLVGDVGGLEEEGDIRKLSVEPFAQPVGILRRGAVVFRLERNQDVAVAHAQRGIVAVSQVESAVGEPDVVDDGIHFAGGMVLRISRSIRTKSSLTLFQARPRRGARVQPHLPGIHRGEEVAADKTGQAQRAGDENRESGQHRSPMAEAPVEQAMVRLAHVLEPVIEKVVNGPDDPFPAGCFAVLRPARTTSPPAAAGSAPWSG